MGINLKTVRIPGILQRIAWAYLCVSIIVLYVPKLKVDTNGSKPSYFHSFRVHALQWVAAISFFVLYLIVMLGVTVPSWSYEFNNHTLHVNCDVKGE